jgi:hypothetical protein
MITEPLEPAARKACLRGASQMEWKDAPLLDDKNVIIDDKNVIVKYHPSQETNCAKGCSGSDSP